jgi:hypothetical protein
MSGPAQLIPASTAIRYLEIPVAAGNQILTYSEERPGDDAADRPRSAKPAHPC